MTTEEQCAAASHDQARSPAPVARPPRQHQQSEPTNYGRRASRISADPVRDNPVVIDLVSRARNGDKQAWDALVERYSPLIWSICRRHRLDDADAEDVGQNAWLQLLGHLESIRDPAALPGWLVTVTHRQCLHVVSKAPALMHARYVMDPEVVPDEQTGTADQELLAAERHAALREAYQDLPQRDRQLIALLIEDPPMHYAEISARLGIPVGTIGPTRKRCLDKLRRHPAIAALIDGSLLFGM